MMIDTHTHYDDEAFDEDRDALLSSLKEQGIEMAVNIGANIERTKKTLDLTESYPFLYGAVGVHPSETEELNESLMDWLEEAAKKPDALPKLLEAIGKTIQQIIK